MIIRLLLESNRVCVYDAFTQRESWVDYFTAAKTLRLYLLRERECGTCIVKRWVLGTVGNILCYVFLPTVFVSIRGLAWESAGQVSGLALHMSTEWEKHTSQTGIIVPGACNRHTYAYGSLCFFSSYITFDFFCPNLPTLLLHENLGRQKTISMKFGKYLSRFGFDSLIRQAS